MSKPRCVLVSASGTSIDDCVMLGYRFGKGAGGKRVEDSWILAQEQESNDPTEHPFTHAQWRYPDLVGLWRSPSKRVYAAHHEGVNVFADILDREKPKVYLFERVAHEHVEQVRLVANLADRLAAHLDRAHALPTFKRTSDPKQARRTRDLASRR